MASPLPPDIDPSTYWMDWLVQVALPLDNRWVHELPHRQPPQGSPQHFDQMFSMDLAEYRRLYPYPNYVPYSLPKASWLAPWHYWFLVVMVACLCFTIYSEARRLIYLRLAIRFGVRYTDYRPWEESFQQLVFYLPAWLLCAGYLLWGPGRGWFFNTLEIWEGNFPNQPLDLVAYGIYGLQTGWYLCCLLTHTTLETRKSDFWYVLLHHAVALVLLYGSLVSGYWRLGLLVLFCMDLCDVFLHLTKLATMVASGHRGLHDAVVVGLFLPLPIAWVALRLVLFPLKVIWPAMYHPLAASGWVHAHGWCLFVPLLWVLWLLQLYWFVLILRVALRKTRGHKIRDIREKLQPDPKGTRLQQTRVRRKQRNPKVE